MRVTITEAVDIACFPSFLFSQNRTSLCKEGPPPKKRGKNICEDIVVDGEIRLVPLTPFPPSSLPFLLSFFLPSLLPLSFPLLPPSLPLPLLSCFPSFCSLSYPFLPLSLPLTLPFLISFLLPTLFPLPSPLPAPSLLLPLHSTPFPTPFFSSSHPHSRFS